MDDNRASAADNIRKISPSCVGSDKLFYTVVSYEKYDFRLFHCVQPTKTITFIAPLGRRPRGSAGDYQVCVCVCVIVLTMRV